MINGLKTMWLRLMWTFIPPETRYAYLWQRTRSGIDADAQAARREKQDDNEYR
ncbi:MAG: hypothetical protein Q8O55_03690 [Dehalococcoidales bacterium]|nr:hypothetical protein [Dehalococcoidales bacterium]